MATARTVLGDVPVERLGTTFPHEHIVVSWASAPYDYDGKYVRKTLADEVCQDLGPAARNHGLRTVVDAGPPELGRDIELQREVAQRLGVNIIAATGCYRHAMGLPFLWQVHDVEALEAHFVKEITEGVGPAKVKCGVIKLASTDDKIDAAEEKAFRAAARASKRTGCPIITHSDPTGWAVTNVGKNQLDILLSEGADPSRIMLGHICGTANLAYLLELVKRGCFIAFDRVGAGGAADEVRAASVAALCGAGYASHVLLSMDHQSVWFPARPSRMGAQRKNFSTLHETFLPRLRSAGVKDNDVEQMLVINPRNLLGF